jgi:hypothetical protein
MCTIVSTPSTGKIQVAQVAEAERKEAAGIKANAVLPCLLFFFITAVSVITIVNSISLFHTLKELIVVKNYRSWVKKSRASKHCLEPSKPMHLMKAIEKLGGVLYYCSQKSPI